MDRELGKDIEAGARRIDFLESNCDKIEEMRDETINEQIATIRELSPEIAIIEQ